MSESNTNDHNLPEMDKMLTKVNKQMSLLSWIMVFMVIGLLFVVFGQPFLASDNGNNAAALAPIEEEDDDFYEIEDGKEVSTGLIVGENWELVKTHCTSCHSAQLVTQNRATKEGWDNMIKWMQENQNLWDLGDDHEGVIEYLATYYGPTDSGRKTALVIDDWYEIK